MILFYDDDLVSFRLIKYNSHIANIDSDDTITLKIKHEENVYTYDLIAYSNDCYFYNTSNCLAIVEMLKSESEISCVIEVEPRYGSNSTYRFDMSGIGFADLLQES